MNIDVILVAIAAVVLAIWSYLKGYKHGVKEIVRCMKGSDPAKKEEGKNVK